MIIKIVALPNLVVAQYSQKVESRARAEKRTCGHRFHIQTFSSPNRSEVVSLEVRVIVNLRVYRFLLEILTSR